MQNQIWWLSVSDGQSVGIRLHSRRGGAAPFPFTFPEEALRPPPPPPQAPLQLHPGAGAPPRRGLRPPGGGAGAAPGGQGVGEAGDPPEPPGAGPGPGPGPGPRVPARVGGLHGRRGLPE